MESTDSDPMKTSYALGVSLPYKPRWYNIEPQPLAMGSDEFYAGFRQQRIFLPEDLCTHAANFLITELRKHAFLVYRAMWLNEEPPTASLVFIHSFPTLMEGFSEAPSEGEDPKSQVPFPQGWDAHGMVDDFAPKYTDLPPLPAGTPYEDIDLLRFFTYAHLPEKLQHYSKPFGHTAFHVVCNFPRGLERTAGLRKLLEAKDACVRVAV